MELAEVLERWREHGMDATATDPHAPDRVFHYPTAFVGNRAVEPQRRSDLDSAQESPKTNVD